SQAVKGGADFTVHTPGAEALGEPVLPSYQDVEQHYESEAQVTGVQAESAADHLFGPEVDNEIDEIFSTLAPAEAQREVGHPHEEAEPVGAFEQEEELAGKPLVPQVEMSATPESGLAPASAPAQEGLFGEQVNQEIDDIFANLAPAEAQLNVSDRDVSK